MVTRQYRKRENPMDLTTPEDRRVYAERVWNLIVATYAEYGNSEDGRLYGAAMEDLIETPGSWKLTMKGEEIIAGVIFRKFKGNKMRLVLHNNTREGKNALKDLFLGEFLHGKCWGECSGHLERILREHGAPVISNTKAAEILEKEIAILDPDGMHYEREVFPGTIKREMLFGQVE
jgi:hypothetical protein